LTELTRPEPAATQVLIRIKTSAINPLDGKIHAGQAPHARQPLPAVLGLDLAGIVEALGEGVTDFRRGDEVYALATGVAGQQGSLAEYAAVDADLVAIKPVNLTMREAAAVPLAFITAWEGLVDRAKVSAAQTVLVHGGAGGVGHMAVQIARAFGAEVFATGSAADALFIERFGATAIDYRGASVEEYVARYTAGRGFDVVYDTVGGAAIDASFNAVRRFGHVVSCLGWGTHPLAPLSFKAATYSGVFTLLPMLTGEGKAHHGEILRSASALIEAGKVVPRIDPRRFTLDDVDAAFKALASGSTGKVVVDVDVSSSQA
jgi:NADPH:quinone reductase-like Zn-dependent oxidoreductase